ncbi:MAG: phage baseplate assembly protein V [Bacteroidales bacterium]|nr:phage baseplate assembly protein V [Bacteroidales bacterium]
MAFAEQVKIKIGKENIEDFLDLNLQQNVFGHHSLEIVCRRDDYEDENGFILDKSDDLFLGKKVSLSIKISDKEKVEFEGIVTELRASKMPDAQSDTIVIEAASPDFLLDDGEHCRTFEEKTLKNIVETVLGEYNLSAVKIDPKSSDAMPYTVQYKESAYAFLTRLASKKGEWFYYDGKDIIFGKRKKKMVELEFGAELFNFDFSLKIDDLKFKYLSYDYLNNKTIESDSSKEDVSNISKKAQVALDKSNKLFKHETLSLYNHNLKKSKEKDHLKSRVKLVKQALASGFISCSGSTDNANLTLGCEIKIKDTLPDGKTVDHGKYIITSLSHSCDRTGNYQNNFTAVPSEIEVPPYSSPHAIPFCETQIAKVMDNNDEKKLGRIRVQFIWQSDENTMTPWLRMVSPHTGKDKGFYFVPEINEQVLVAFEGGNAEKPYVVGSMYHGEAEPDARWVNDKDDIKAIRTRGGHTIEFNDKDGGEEMKIYDSDKENYVITLSSHSKEITIESKGDLILEAKENIKIKANNIEMESAKDISLKGSNIASEASAGMKLDGGGKLEASAGMIKIG